MDSTNFIHGIIDEELSSGKVSGVYTRFRPSLTVICT